MTTNLRKWSQTATGNASVAGGANTINFSEGQAPSTVNNSAREMMAQVRGWYTAAEAGWIEQSNTASIASQTVFKLSGDQTANWTAGRRWRLRGGSTVRLGSVVSSSYTAETTITVTVDSGSLSASHSIAALASITTDHIPANSYVTSASLATTVATLVSSASLATALAPYMTSASSSAAITAALGPYITSASSSAAITAAIAASAGVEVIAVATSVGSSATLVVGSGTITKAYKRLVIIFDGISHDDSGSNGSFSIEITGNNGTNYGSAITFTANVSNATAIDAIITIDNAATASGNRVVSIPAVGTNTTGGVTIQSIATGYINGFRLDCTQGQLDAGTYSLIGFL